MADDILRNTLAGTLPKTPSALQAPTLTGDNKKDIASLSGAQKQPSQLLDLQKTMQLASSQAYKERQAAEMEITSTQFDPTKVSGNTFGSIISNLEANRGADISKIYASTMSTYVKVQEQITSRLEFLEQLEEQRRQFEEEMEFKKKELARLEKEDKRAAKQYKEQFEEDKRRWEINYADSKKKISQETAVATNQLEDLLYNQYSGEMSYNTPTGQAPSFTDWLK